MVEASYKRLNFAEATDLHTVNIVTDVHSQSIKGTISTLISMLETAKHLPSFQTLNLAWIFRPGYSGDSITFPGRNDDWSRFGEILGAIPSFQALNVIGVLDLDFAVEESDASPEDVAEQAEKYFLSSLSIVSNHPNIRLSVSVQRNPTRLDIRLYKASIFDSLVLEPGDSALAQ